MFYGEMHYHKKITSKAVIYRLLFTGSANWLLFTGCYLQDQPTGCYLQAVIYNNIGDVVSESAQNQVHATD